MILHIYQIIGILIGIIAIALSLWRFKDGKMSPGMLSVWILIWAAVIIISIYPESTNLLATVTGIGRGLDFILIIGLIGSYYLIFKMYNAIESMENEITKLVRELALQRENIEEKTEKKS